MTATIDIDARRPGAAERSHLANAIRALSMDAVERAASGHPGMPMGMADVATVLFTQFLKFDPSDPQWPDRDRFVLSAGHGSMLLYALLYLTGYKGVTLDDLKSFRQLGSKAAGHPEYGHMPGVEVTTGPLGQGIATAVGMALAERMLNARFGDALVDHRTFVIAGDGCLMEGLSHEAIDLAGHLRLSRLIVLFDDNGISIDGSTALSTSMDQAARFRAAGWSTRTVDGHDPEAVAAAIAAELETDRPSLIACRTVIGRGAPGKQGTSAAHGSPLGESEIAAARAALDWPHGPFEVPEPVLSAWRAAGARGAADRDAWAGRLAQSALGDAFLSALAEPLPAGTVETVNALKAAFAETRPNLATRQSSQRVLEVLAGSVPQLVGGSADLTGSNGTKVKAQRPVTADDLSGAYIHYGVREHGMAAAMNGLALHGGLIPYGGTFLAFADYARPAIRLAALMGIRVIHVMTHDSIGLGEDGPTHQPVEHLASLRAMPNLLVFRPADAVEAAESWLCALGHATGPSILCLSRQALPTLRTEHTAVNRVAQGGYVIRGPFTGREVTLIATGSEVAIACEAADTLAGEGIRAAVVSMPCRELFRRQPKAYRETVLGPAPRIVVEAAVEDGWCRELGPDGVFIGMDGFGASAPAEALYEHFGLTAARVAETALSLAR
ncbi:transketolase [Arenibaculum pallidiluteum]|uniref:transketolase n=1 Tax=Arenibaculum pallidiluteum TaxID=2812559 RepID=UPI002E2A81A7|nr:transketolase [Arenibaculum pallidiluteum]